MCGTHKAFSGRLGARVKFVKIGRDVQQPGLKCETGVGGGGGVSTREAQKAGEPGRDTPGEGGVGAGTPARRRAAGGAKCAPKCLRARIGALGRTHWNRRVEREEAGAKRRPKSKCNGFNKCVGGRSLAVFKR